MTPALTPEQEERRREFEQTRAQAQQRQFFDNLLARFAPPPTANPFEPTTMDIFQPVGSVQAPSVNDQVAALAGLFGQAGLPAAAPTAEPALPPEFVQTMQQASQQPMGLAPSAGGLAATARDQIPAGQLERLMQLMGLARPSAQDAVQQPAGPMQPEMPALPATGPAAAPSSPETTAALPPGFTQSMKMANEPAPRAPGAPATASPPGLSRFSMPAPVPRPELPREEGTVGRMGGPFRDFR